MDGYVDDAATPQMKLAVVREIRGAEQRVALSDRALEVTMRVTKEAIRRLQMAGLPADDDLVRAAYGSADFHEGVTAFVEKRPAKWTGK
jgi:enoyl-CoA hydratase/carnithine racemase